MPTYDMTGPGSTNFIAPPMENLLKQAKACVMAHYVAQAEKDGVPATQRAMYVLKALDAKAVLDGGRVASLEAEAAALGVSVQALAKSICDMADQSRALELQRMRVNIELAEAFDSNALDPTPMLKVLDKYGIELT